VDNFQTIEVRWFYPGILPDEVRQWFNHLGEQLEKIDTRSDVYLQSHAPDIGVKLRQGNLEVKYRQQNLGTIAIEGMENSQVEQWSKWICVDRSSGITPTNTVSKPGWLKVVSSGFCRFSTTYADCQPNSGYCRDRTNTVTITITNLVDDRL
jgi:hypothetical protein